MTVLPEKEIAVVVGMTWATPKAAVCLQGRWYRVFKERTCGYSHTTKRITCKHDTGPLQRHGMA